MRKNTIILFYPTPVTNAKKSLPLNLMAIARMIDKSRHQIVIINATIDKNFAGVITNHLKKKDVLCLGITAMTGFQIKEGLKIARMVKDSFPEVPIIWGGYHPSILPQETVKDANVDIVVKGQGEITFREVIDALSESNSLEHIQGIAYKRKDGSIIENTDRSFVSLDEFPVLDWELIDSTRYVDTDPMWGRFMSYYTSQGCPFNCGFCAETVFCKQQWVALNAQRTVDEIELIVKKYHVRSILVRDSNFFVNKKRVIEICRLIKERGLNVKFFGLNARVDTLLSYDESTWELMCSAGFSELLIGAESGDQAVLDLINKRSTVEDTLKLLQVASRHHIGLWVSLMIGLPGFDTKKEFDATISLLDKMLATKTDCVTNSYIFTYTPYPGSSLYKLAMEYGFKPPDSLSQWSKMDLFSNKNQWLQKKYSRYANAVSLYILRRFFNNSTDMFLRNWFYSFIDPIFKWRWKNRYFNYFAEKYIIDMAQFIMNLLRKIRS